MGVTGLKKEQVLLFVLALALITALTLIVFSQADNMYLLKIKGDGTTRVLTKDIRVGPVPFLFWGVLLLYTWLASLWSRIPIKKFLKRMAITGIIMHQFLLLLQFELQYPLLKESIGAYTSGLYYGYMRGIFFLLLLLLGGVSAWYWKKWNAQSLDHQTMITHLPYGFLFLATLLLSFSHWAWMVIGMLGFALGSIWHSVRGNSTMVQYRQRLLLLSKKWILPALCLIAFLAVIGFSFRLIAMHGEEFRSAGDDNWSLPAESFAKNALHPEIWNMDIALGYILFLGTIYKIFGINFYAVGIIQALLAAISVALLHSIGKRLFSEEVGLVAAALLALNGPFLNILSTLSTEGVYTFLILLMFWALVWYKAKAEEKQQRNQMKWCALALAGIAFAAAELVKPQTLLFLIPILLWFWFAKKALRWKAIVGFILAAILFTVPFAMYDVAINGKFTIIQAGGARAFTNMMGRTLNAVGLNPYQQGVVGYTEGLVEHRQEAIGVLTSFLPKFFIRFFFSDWFGIFDLLLLHRHSLFAYQLRFYAYCAILIGAFLVWKRRKEIGERWKDQFLVFSFIPYTTAIILLVSSSKVRYRLPLDPFFIMLMAITLCWMWQTKKHTAQKTIEKHSRT